MPAIGYLLSLWSTGRRSFLISRRAISTDRGHGLVLTQPFRKGRRFTTRQEVDDLMLFQVHQHRAVLATWPQSEVIDAQDFYLARRFFHRRREFANALDQGRGAHLIADLVCQ